MFCALFSDCTVGCKNISAPTVFEIFLCDAVFSYFCIEILANGDADMHFKAMKICSRSMKKVLKHRSDEYE